MNIQTLCIKEVKSLESVNIPTGSSFFFLMKISCAGSNYASPPISCIYRTPCFVSACKKPSTIISDSIDGALSFQFL